MPTYQEFLADLNGTIEKVNESVTQTFADVGEEHRKTQDQINTAFINANDQVFKKSTEVTKANNAANEKSAEKQSKIKKVKGKRISCCDLIVPVEYQYCPSCGKAIINSEEAEFDLDLEQTLTSCANCGKLLVLYGDYCGYCGQRTSLKNQDKN